MINLRSCDADADDTQLYQGSAHRFSRSIEFAPRSFLGNIGEALQDSSVISGRYSEDHDDAAEYTDGQMDMRGEPICEGRRDVTVRDTDDRRSVLIRA